MKRPAFIALFGFLVVMTLNFSGFCYHKLRYCSDRELIDAAATRALKWRQDLQFSGSPIVYASLDDFYAKNSNCCTLDRWDARNTSILARAFGFYVAMADIWYRQSEDGKEPYYYAEVSLSAYGEPMHIRGIPFSFGRP